MVDFTIAVPVIIGLVEAIKRIGLSSNYAGIVSVLIGVVGFYFLADGEVGARVFEGIVSGLSAAGLYSTTKATIRE